MKIKSVVAAAAATLEGMTAAHADTFRGLYQPIQPPQSIDIGKVELGKKLFFAPPFVQVGFRFLQVLSRPTPFDEWLSREPANRPSSEGLFFSSLCVVTVLLRAAVGSCPKFGSPGIAKNTGATQNRSLHSGSA